MELRSMSWKTWKVAVAALFVGATGLVTTFVMPGADPALAAKPRINTIGSPGVAIKGFDPVAYFTVGKPTKGSKEHELTHKGAKWRFASAENKALFEANPAKYEPAYGGYCAYGVAQGSLVKIEGNSWAIRNGKLYLNYNRSVQKRWARSPASYIKQANRKFSRLLKK